MQGLRDLVVRVAPRYEFGDLAFARGENGRRVAGAARFDAP